MKAPAVGVSLMAERDFSFRPGLTAMEPTPSFLVLGKLKYGRTEATIQSTKGLTVSEEQ